MVRGKTPQKILEVICMLNDRTTEISHLETKLGELQKDMALLHSSQDEVNKNIKQMEHKLKDLNSDRRIIDHKLHTSTRASQAGVYQLQKLRIEQRQFEKKQEIKRLKSEQPTFLQCVEQLLLDKQSEQDKRLNFPVEQKTDAKKIMNQLRKLEEQDFVQRNGYTETFHVYNNFKMAYDERLGEIVEASIAGIERDGISAMFAQMATDLLKNRHIQTHLR